MPGLETPRGSSPAAMVSAGGPRGRRGARGGGGAGVLCCPSAGPAVCPGPAGSQGLSPARAPGGPGPATGSRLAAARPGAAAPGGLPAFGEGILPGKNVCKGEILPGSVCARRWRELQVFFGASRGLALFASNLALDELQK